VREVTLDGETVEACPDLEVRPPGPNEVAVRIHAADVCHSDISVTNGRDHLRPVALSRPGINLAAAPKEETSCSTM